MKDCPFCHSSDVFILRTEDSPDLCIGWGFSYANVKCSNCGAGGPVVKDMPGDINPDDPIKLWDNR